MGLKRIAAALTTIPFCIVLAFTSSADARPKRGLVNFISPPKAVSSVSSAQECSKCHSDIFRNWKRSRHAAAYENPVFQTAYQKTWLEEGADAARSCLPCHAPAARNGSPTPPDASAREGVACETCHGAMETETPAPSAKQNAAPNATAHHRETRRPGAFAGQSCAACHDFKNRHNVPIGTTFGEWRASSASPSGHCPGCHMPLVAGRTANKYGRDEMHDHSLATGLDSLKGAVTVEIENVALEEGRLTVSITIRNIGAGHSVPTGSPARWLVLEARLTNGNGGVVETQKRIYRRTLTGQNGAETVSFNEAFLHATAVAADNRLGPEEMRTETFSFGAPPDEHAKITAEIYLLAAPETAQRDEMRIPLSGPAEN